MVRLPALRAWAIGTTFCCLTLAQRALCAAAILARALALNLRRGLRAMPPPPISNPLSAAIAVSRPFNCRAILSRSAFNCASLREYVHVCSPSDGMVTRDKSLSFRKQRPRISDLCQGRRRVKLLLPLEIMLDFSAQEGAKKLNWPPVSVHLLRPRAQS